MSLDRLPPELLEKITRRKCLEHKDLVALHQTCRRLRAFPAPLEVQTLKLQMVGDKLHTTAIIQDRFTALNFPSEHEKSVKNTTKNDEESRLVTRFWAFVFPPQEEFALFHSARIGHVEINKNYPLFLEGDNLRYLTVVLKGCIIDKVTLVLNQLSTNSLNKVPSFLASVQARKVEFIAHASGDMISPYEQEGFAENLAKAGIREVTFTLHTANFRSNIGNSLVWYHADWPGTEPFPFTLLLNLFRAGITNIVVNPKALDVARSISQAVFDTFLDDLADLGHSLRLELHLFDGIRKNSGGSLVGGPEGFRPEPLSSGPYTRPDDEKYGRCVNVISTKNQHEVIVEYNRSEQDA